MLPFDKQVGRRDNAPVVRRHNGGVVARAD
jgi:hypothetical protein